MFQPRLLLLIRGIKLSHFSTIPILPVSFNKYTQILFLGHSWAGKWPDKLCIQICRCLMRLNVWNAGCDTPVLNALSSQCLQAAPLLVVSAPVQSTCRGAVFMKRLTGKTGISFSSAHPITCWCYGTAWLILLLNTDLAWRATEPGSPGILALWKFNWLIDLFWGGGGNQFKKELSSLVKMFLYWIADNIPPIAISVEREIILDAYEWLLCLLDDTIIDTQQKY